MFRALLVCLQETLHKRRLVYYVRVMSVGCTIPFLVQPTDITRMQYTKCRSNADLLNVQSYAKVHDFYSVTAQNTIVCAQVTRQNAVNMQKQVTTHPILSTTRSPQCILYIATPHMPPYPLDRSYISSNAPHLIIPLRTLYRPHSNPPVFIPSCICIY
jgi:hypothetical protein